MRRKIDSFGMLLVSTSLILLMGAAEARDRVLIAGSATVGPFVQIAIGRFNAVTPYEARYFTVGTGGGFRNFCDGMGDDFVDFAAAARPIRLSEIERCTDNGVTESHAIQIGWDGIVLARSAEAPRMSLTRAQLFAALAAEVEIDGRIVANPYRMWRDIDPSLPFEEIVVLGPSATSDTRDAFVEQVMASGCRDYDAIRALGDTNEDRFEAICSTIREDGVFIEMSEDDLVIGAGTNDNVIILRLLGMPTALGIIGHSSFDENYGLLRGSMIDGVDPSFENIADGVYPVVRPLLLYMKIQHIAEIVPGGMRAFVQELTAESTFGDEGYLVDAGMIPLSAEERAAVREAAMAHFR